MIRARQQLRSSLGRRSQTKLPLISRQWVFLCVATVCILALVVANGIAQEKLEGQQNKPATGTYSGKIVALAGPLSGTPSDLVVKVYSYSSETELQQYEQLLGKHAAQQPLAEAVHRHDDRGTFRTGTDLV